MRFINRWFTNRIHVDDIVAILQRIHSGERQLQKYEVLNVSDDCPAPIIEEVDRYVKILGLPASQEGGSIQASSKREEQSQRVSNAKLKGVRAPFSFKYPTYREGAGSEL